MRPGIKGTRKIVQVVAGFRTSRGRNSNNWFPALSLMVLAAAGALRVEAQTSVTTWHNDIGRTGQNLNETILTTSNVNATQFGKLFSQPVDGQMYAQPLYLPNVTIGGQQHNVVFVATENDTVYAFDADSNGAANANPLWQASMLTAAHGATAGATAFPASAVSADLAPLIGITGTPVIDPTTNTLYVVSKTLENNKAVQRLHALDVTTGNEKFGGPVLVTATISGTGNGSVSGQLTFDPMWENQRPGLLLLNGIVYVAFGSHGDGGPWHGWILAYNAATLQQTAAYNASPNGTGAGFWLSGAGPAADLLNPSTQPYGRMFVPTGNGDYTGAIPYTNNMDYGDSILNLNLANGAPTVQDEFTPYNQATLDGEDGDVGSGGTMVIPTQTTGSYPHLLIQAGKTGTIYLVNRDQMGGYHGTDNIVQEIPGGLHYSWNTAAYWNGTIYFWGVNDKLKCFPLVNGQLSTSPTTSSESYGYPGSTLSISANGNTQGIVWSIDSEAYTSSGQAVLQAHDAGNCGTTLYSSATNPSRDNPGVAVKFAVPTVANGKVYVGTSNQLSVYGLLGATQQAATPVLTPGSQTFTGSLSVTITDATPGAAIYYTTNGTTPSTSSTPYSGPITVTGTETIQAIASATGYLASAVASATYTDMIQANAPSFSVPAGTYTSTQSVILSDTTPGATIHYTTDGSAPTASSNVYTPSTLISVSQTETINALAIAPGYLNSPVASATYTIVPPIYFPTGFASSKGLVILNGSSRLDDSRLQLTDGGTYQIGTAWFATPVNVQSFTTNFTFQLSNPAADGITFTIQGKGTSAMGGDGSNLGYAGIPTSVAVKFDLYNDAHEGQNSTGLYVNGARPTIPAIDLSPSGINLHSDDVMSVQLTYDGATLAMTMTDIVTLATFSTSFPINIPATVGGNTAYVGFTGSTFVLTSSQKILTWSYAPGPVVSYPVIQPGTGLYASAQSVTISDSTPGAVIYYTTNGTAPTTSSTVYTGTPISVTSSETIQAIAVASGSANSGLATASCFIGPAAPPPTFSQPSGTYSNSLITISDAVPGATIYYTTNGSTPTASSAKYSYPMTLSNARTVTLKAIAVVNGFANSPVTTVVYKIQPILATPAFSLPAATYATPQTVTISDVSKGVTIYYTTDGSIPSTSSLVYTGPITVSSTETISAIAIMAGWTNSPVAAATYTISTAVPPPVISVPSGTYTSTTVSISDGLTGTSIYYTLNGSTPTTSSTLYTAPVLFKSSGTFTLKAIAALSASVNSPVTTAVYTIDPVLARPTFSVASGTYASPQTVAISDVSIHATIYYTTDGSTPTTSSPVYTGPVTVSSSETISAMAVESGFTNSPEASATYTIQ
ncbi:MAG: chitobiase/beta-hexosaminidase C-terminal domain-containing protein [Acidobacteriaceae bacterium]|nr:chitobiase/beta-hexosaminidase C-terminal domain-containing protein [Acidobacteriaceae bacterium]